MMNLKSKIQFISSISGILIILSGCTNSFVTGLSTQVGSNLSGSNGTSGPTGTSGAQDKFVISTVSIAAGAGNGTYVTSIYFDSSKSVNSSTGGGVQITSHCALSNTGGQSAKGCLCQFSWPEVNSTGTASGSITRNVTSAVTAVNIGGVTCNAPDVYSTEIPDGTQMKITVIPDPNNADNGQFSVNTYNFSKATTVTSGSFSDSQGHIFNNVLHYSCFQKFQRGLAVQSRSFTQNNQNTGVQSQPIVSASQFCISGSAGSTGAGCGSIPQPGLSAQSYFYNLYIRDTERGNINQFNDSYTCPTVTESLNNNNTIGTKNQAWPLDTNFALTLNYAAPTFTVGVVANTKLANGSDPTSANSTCSITPNNNGNANTTTSTNTLIQSCLGFAAAVNSDGTCPYFKDSSGQIRQTFRLRRYVTTYPKLFSADGKPLTNTGQAIDTIYVLDRPVKGPATANPLQPYTMRGPKPCPFAYFDQKGVTTGNAVVGAYTATNSSLWNGKNVDGIELPNFDKIPTGSQTVAPSCSTALPVLDSTKSTFYISTVNVNNTSGYSHVYIRPVAPFAPHYEEDTSFLACAPQASPLLDAPLHFARDSATGNVGWCTESYPSQNNNIKSLDPPIRTSGGGSVPTIPTGQVAPYTSHTVKNSASTTCAASQLSPSVSSLSPTYDYASSAGPKYALHLNATAWDNGAAADVTCDRTVSTQGQTWTNFPLLAPSADVENAIKNDKTYYCTVSYDNKGGKTDLQTPTSGCCDSASVFLATLPGATGSAHLEPDVPCKIPTY